MIGARVFVVLLVLPAAACFSPSGGPAGATESTSTSTSPTPSTSTLTEGGPTTSTATTAPGPTSTSDGTSTSTSTTTPVDPTSTTTLDATTTTTTTTGDETTDSDATSTSTSSTTSSTSTGLASECGNGMVELGEVCDDGNDIDTDTCTSACKLPKCGDGIVHADEECDEITDNCMGCQRSWMQVFVTSTKSSGDLDGLDGADKFCEQRAANAGIQGRFKAWISTDMQSAGARLHHSTRPYKRLDKAVVANSWADLADGTLQNEIDIDENGDSAAQMTGCGACEVWTASKTNGDGGYSDDCNGWSISALLYGRVGECSLKDARWTDGCGTLMCVLNARLYCLEQGLAP
ncbi:DUF4215 domain-containing protein [Nannocystis sp. SCPEA4]|uniref:DUF4215 domain-containing protein n=1 Tax=Nannocystis sp. SCPEA4 TaxID=2996787 RepID=UPI00226EDD3F|nr:DUF4215 domain-containing protein [Nannocystis sp. SCPEA4]MCY1054748.1 DUF4215 domain-containing protein [Nannocystis sp. SCPEA4]